MEDDEQELDFGILVGKTITYAMQSGPSDYLDLLTGKRGQHSGGEYHVRLYTEDGSRVFMSPEEDDDCCNANIAKVQEVTGMENLIDATIISAYIDEDADSDSPPLEEVLPLVASNSPYVTWRWTTYVMVTEKGEAKIRWYWVRKPYGWKCCCGDSDRYMSGSVVFH